MKSSLAPLRAAHAAAPVKLHHMSEECTGSNVSLALVATALAFLVLSFCGTTLVDYLYGWTIVRWQQGQDPVASSTHRSLLFKGQQKKRVFKVGQVLPHIDVSLSNPFASRCRQNEEKRKRFGVGDIVEKIG